MPLRIAPLEHIATPGRRFKGLRPGASKASRRPGAIAAAAEACLRPECTIAHSSLDRAPRRNSSLDFRKPLAVCTLSSQHGKAHGNLPAAAQRGCNFGMLLYPEPAAGEGRRNCGAAPRAGSVGFARTERLWVATAEKGRCEACGPRGALCEDRLPPTKTQDPRLHGLTTPRWITRAGVAQVEQSLADVLNIPCSCACGRPAPDFLRREARDR